MGTGSSEKVELLRVLYDLSKIFHSDSRVDGLLSGAMRRSHGGRILIDCRHTTSDIQNVVMEKSCNFFFLGVKFMQL